TKVALTQKKEWHGSAIPFLMHLAKVIFSTNRVVARRLGRWSKNRNEKPRIVEQPVLGWQRSSHRLSKQRKVGTSQCIDRSGPCSCHQIRVGQSKLGLRLRSRPGSPCMSWKLGLGSCNCFAQLVVARSKPELDFASFGLAQLGLPFELALGLFRRCP